MKRNGSHLLTLLNLLLKVTAHRLLESLAFVLELVQKPLYLLPRAYEPPQFCNSHGLGLVGLDLDLDSSHSLITASEIETVDEIEYAPFFLFDHCGVVGLFFDEVEASTS